MKISSINGIADLAGSFSSINTPDTGWLSNVITGVTGFIQNNPGVVSTGVNLVNRATGSTIPTGTQAQQYQIPNQSSNNTVLYIGLGIVALGGIYLLSRNNKKR